MKKIIDLGDETLTSKDCILLSALTLMSLLIANLVEVFAGHYVVGIIFLFIICISGVALSRTAVFILTTFLSLCHNFFFIPPLYSFSISSGEDIVFFSVFFVTAVLSGNLTSRLKYREKISNKRESLLMQQFDLSRLLAQAQSVDEVAQVVMNLLKHNLSDATCIYLEKNSHLQILPQSQFGFQEKEKAIAEWVMRNNCEAGNFTKTLPANEACYMPITGKEKIIGVLGIKKSAIFSCEEKYFIESVIHQLASAFEREIYHEKSRSLSIMEESQRLYKTLFDSVSHELKTPLSAIMGSASALLDPIIENNPQANTMLAQEILLGAFRLKSLVENLLDMTRVESGMLKAKLRAFPVNEMIDYCLRNFRHQNRVFKLDIEHPIPEILCDPGLFEQAIINIIQNSISYGQDPIEINVRVLLNEVELTIRDHGKGLPVMNPAIVFDKFFRASPQHTGGVGLGLSITRNFIELQGGTICAKNHPKGGAEFIMKIPRPKHDYSSSQGYSSESTKNQLASH